MALQFYSTPTLKRISIVAGFIAALLAADILTRQYIAHKDKLLYLCTYRFEQGCGCAPTDRVCVEKCETLRQSHTAECSEEIAPSLYKLQDRFTWALLGWLPLVYCLAVAAIHIMGWVSVKLRKTKA